MGKKKNTSPTALDHTMAYVKSFLKDKNVASVTPTSANVVNKICDRMDFSRDVVVIEYGAGTGVFTFEMMKRMSSGSRLLAFETNSDLAAMLRKHADERMIISEESAELVTQVREQADLPLADYVLSGIPFSFLKSDIREKLVVKTKENLKNGGHFMAYQASWLMKDTIENVFGNLDTESYLFNIPPMFLMDAIRSEPNKPLNDE
ncbi:MAG: hypothetical protein JJU41_04055 [Bacteroidetes bacterium]|nr:hypothetical protein [Bacteroidota bacterium]